MRAQQLHWLYDSLIVAIIAAFSLCIPLQIMVFVMPMFTSPMRAISLKGRPFAYNPRNVPSEGFTSLLYSAVASAHRIAGGLPWQSVQLRSLVQATSKRG